MRIKELVEILDPIPLIDGRMLELTRWLAEYYACSWGQALDAAVPAGVKKHAGTRVGTFLVVPEETREAMRAGPIEPKLSAKQTAVLEVLCRGDEPLTTSDVCRLAKCSPVPVQALLKRGWCTPSAAGCRWASGGPPRRPPSRLAPRPRRRRPARALRPGREARAGADRRAGGDPGADRAGAGVGRVRAVPDPRGDRQRQDRGLPLGDRAGGGAGAGGDRAGPRDQPDAADDPPVPPPVRPGRRAAQPPERRRAASALAEHRRGRGRGRRRRRGRPSSRRRGGWA